MWMNAMELMECSWMTKNATFANELNEMNDLDVIISSQWNH